MTAPEIDPDPTMVGLMAKTQEQKDERMALELFPDIPEKQSQHEGLSDYQIVTAGLVLAKRFYKSFGNDVPDGFRFFESHHPLERGCWNLAVIAFEQLCGTDLNEALANCEE